MVVVGTPDAAGHLKWRTASRKSVTSIASIIRTVKPGVYKDRATNRPYHVMQDAIVYEQLESGTLLLFRSGDEFTSITLTF
jgi:hypothetical protein